MSSPPKVEEAEVVQSTPEDIDPEKPMDDTQGQGLEVEVKEQDRWLPIANGTWYFFSLTRIEVCSHFARSDLPYLLHI